MKVQAQIKIPHAEPGYLRVAFASNDGERVDSHFGKGKSFFLFDVSQTGYLKSGKILFAEEAGEEGMDHVERNLIKAEALKDCHIIYSTAIGGPVAAKLTQNKIQPLVVKDEDQIEKLLEQFQGMLAGRPPRWVEKLIRPDDPGRFAQFDDDDE